MICADKKITVFHYNKDDENITSYGNVSVFSSISARVDDNGLLSNSEIRIRIPANEELCVAVGDRVLLRQLNADENIPYEETFSVVKVKNNIRGSKEVGHYLIVCR